MTPACCSHRSDTCRSANGGGYYAISFRFFFYFGISTVAAVEDAGEDESLNKIKNPCVIEFYHLPLDGFSPPPAQTRSKSNERFLPLLDYLLKSSTSRSSSRERRRRRQRRGLCSVATIAFETASRNFWLFYKMTQIERPRRAHVRTDVPTRPNKKTRWRHFKSPAAATSGRRQLLMKPSSTHYTTLAQLYVCIRDRCVQLFLLNRLLLLVSSLNKPRSQVALICLCFDALLLPLPCGWIVF